MKQKSTLKRLRDFWVIPFLTGIFFSTGYEVTKRQLSSSKLITQDKSIKTTINSSSPSDDSTLFQPLSKTSNKDKIFTPQEKTAEVSKESTKAEESKKLLPEKTSFKKFPTQNPEEFINNEINSKDNLSHQNGKFIENLFNSLPDP
mgnify:CR=1 FL=1